MVEMLKLTDKKATKADQLSGGMKRKLRLVNCTSSESLYAGVTLPYRFYIWGGARSLKSLCYPNFGFF